MDQFLCFIYQVENCLKMARYNRTVEKAYHICGVFFLVVL